MKRCYFTISIAGLLQLRKRHENHAMARGDSGHHDSVSRKISLFDYDFLSRHCKWLVESGCDGVVALGSLGEGATLTLQEKREVLETCVRAVGEQALTSWPGVSALSTVEAVAIAKTAEAGRVRRADGAASVRVCRRLAGDARTCGRGALGDTAFGDAVQQSDRVHSGFSAGACGGTDGRYPTLHAIKESSADVRRIAALRALAGDRLSILCGVDDLIVELSTRARWAGSRGWRTRFRRESVELFQLAMDGEKEKAFEIYRWFLPLLRMDTVPKFVQLIKLVQAGDRGWAAIGCGLRGCR